MAYIKRKGILIDWITLIITSVIIFLFYTNTNWPNQLIVFEEFAESFSLEFLLVSNVPEIYYMLGIYVLLGVIVAWMWYLLGKVLAPLMVRVVVKFLGGLASKPFIDKDVNKKPISWIKFVIYWYNLSISLFALDFLLVNSVFYRQGLPPTFLSLLVSIGFLSLLQPIYLVYDSVGIRSLNDRNSEIYSVSTIMGRMTYRLIQTGGLLAILASISLNADIIDSVPVSIRVIFVRTLLVSTLALFFTLTFFQSEAIFDDWKKKSIPGGKTFVKFT